MSKAAENTSALSSAIDDIRHKLVEEPWFGQNTTENIELPANEHTEYVHPDQSQNESFESFYGITPENDTHAQNSPAEQQQQLENNQQEQEL